MGMDSCTWVPGLAFATGLRLLRRDRYHHDIHTLEAVETSSAVAAIPLDMADSGAIIKPQSHTLRHPWHEGHDPA